MKFIWDDQKKRSNFDKHGFSFEDVSLVFSGETVTFLDDRFDYGEKRFITLGKLVGRVAVVVHTPRGEAMRIISMRKANEKEKNIYQEQLKKSRRPKR